MNNVRMPDHPLQQTILQNFHMFSEARDMHFLLHHKYIDIRQILF